MPPARSRCSACASSRPPARPLRWSPAHECHRRLLPARPTAAAISAGPRRTGSSTSVLRHGPRGDRAHRLDRVLGLAVGLPRPPPVSCSAWPSLGVPRAGTGQSCSLRRRARRCPLPPWGRLRCATGLIGGVAPSPTTLTDLASAAVTGWKRWLTLLPPVDARPLVALPWLTGLAGGRPDLWHRPALVLGPGRAIAPIGLLVGRIALGTNAVGRPKFIQGVLFPPRPRPCGLPPARLQIGLDAERGPFRATGDRCRTARV